MNRLSVVLATYNEEKNLEDCLRSICDIAWEIVVVDGASQDKTVAIAKKYGAKVSITDNPQNFHINKNKAIDKAVGDWIFQLDADERVTEELKREIRQAIGKNEQVNGYWIPRKNFFLGRFLKKGGQYPDYTLRLYKKGKGKLPAKDVHEQAEVEGKVGYLKNDLLHIRDKNFSTYMDGFNRYTDLMANDLKKRKDGKLLSFFNFVFLKPAIWFMKAYIRHKGFEDGFPGFIFALFSSLRFPVSYFKYLTND
ncbi:MAG: glycosyltransferase family 2 protein [Candidatus Daviesbacteria bacterium]|nr:glycosyltransferase family 2 protein [Candidatus Daviesbacteria bacterium]